MDSPLLHEPSHDSEEMAHANEAEGGASSVRITLTVANRYVFDTHRVRGRQIKETAGVPAGFALYRRTRDGNEPVRDDAQIELRNGDHFFARPGSSAP